MNQRSMPYDLAKLPEKSLLDERMLAKMFGVNQRTIIRWTQCNELPTPTRLAGRRRWMAGTLVSYFEQQMRPCIGNASVKCPKPPNTDYLSTFSVYLSLSVPRRLKNNQELRRLGDSLRCELPRPRNNFPLYFEKRSRQPPAM